MITAAYLAMCCSCGGSDVLWLLLLCAQYTVQWCGPSEKCAGQLPTGQLITALHITPANSLFKVLCVNNVQGESAHLTCAMFITVDVLFLRLGALIILYAAYCL